MSIESSQGGRQTRAGCCYIDRGLRWGRLWGEKRAEVWGSFAQDICSTTSFSAGQAIGYRERAGGEGLNLGFSSVETHGVRIVHRGRVDKEDDWQLWVTSEHCREGDTEKQCQER